MESVLLSKVDHESIGVNANDMFWTITSPLSIAERINQALGKERIYDHLHLPTLYAFEYEGKLCLFSFTLSIEHEESKTKYVIPVLAINGLIFDAENDSYLFEFELSKNGLWTNTSQVAQLRLIDSICRNLRDQLGYIFLLQIASLCNQREIRVDLLPQSIPFDIQKQVKSMFGHEIRDDFDRLLSYLHEPLTFSLMIPMPIYNRSGQQEGGSAMQLA